jgi:uncharacterized PurR-regulated membrane protein YhhQ (DUF165 family)
MERHFTLDERMRPFVQFMAVGFISLAIQVVSPFSGRRFDGNSLDLAFGGLALVAFIGATLWAAIKGPRQARQIIVAFWVLAFVALILVTTVTMVAP